MVIASSHGNASLQNGRAPVDFSRSRTKTWVSRQGLIQVPGAVPPVLGSLSSQELGNCNLSWVCSWGFGLGTDGPELAGAAQEKSKS